MIRVRRPAVGPAILTDPARPGGGRRRTAELVARAEAAGGDPGPVPAVCYNDPSVKRVLIEAQHGKCCFCEQKVTAWRTAT